MVNERKIPEGYKKSEIGIIPDDWEVGKIGELYDFKNGLNKPKHFFGYGTPIVNYMDVYSKKGLCSKDIKGRVSVSNDEIRAYNVQKGDVFFTRTSEIPEEVGIAATIIEDVSDTVFSGFILRARPKTNKIDIGYQKYCFASEQARRQIVASCTYTTRALINGRSLSAVSIPIPPLKEQHFIAQALSDIDDLIASLEKLIEKKRLIKQGTIQQFLTGKKRLDGFSREWRTRKLRDCIHGNPKYGINAPAVEFSYDLPSYLRITDITDEGHYDINNKVSVSDSSAMDYILEEGDFVFARTGASTGKTYLYNPKDGTLVYAGFLIRVKPNKNILDPKFLKYYCQTSQYWSWVKVMSMRSGQPGINGQEYAELELTIPSLPEQHAIVQILSDMDAEIEVLEKKLDKYKSIKQGMMQELLTGKRRLV